MAAARRLALRWAVLPSAVALVATAACGGSPARKPVTAGRSSPPAAAVGYAAELGGLGPLVAAARKEGRLTVVGLPPRWANYGQVIEAFTAAYGIAVDQRQPDASSRQEIDAARRAARTATAPDVFDLDPAVAAANKGMLAPYKVTTWGDIPDAVKDPGGAFVGAYGGVASIGYDPARVPRPARVADLLGPRYAGAVALPGDPRRLSSALYATLMLSLGSGGSADDIAPGVRFVSELARAGNLDTAARTWSAAPSGRGAVRLDWDYLNVQAAGSSTRASGSGAPGSASTGRGTSASGWRVVIPKPAVASYFVQAINRDAAHPAAARLWQEFVLSDVGQNLLLRSYARPTRADAMRRAGTLDRTYWDALPALPGTPIYPTPDQLATARRYLAGNWDAAIKTPTQ